MRPSLLKNSRPLGNDLYSLEVFPFLLYLLLCVLSGRSYELFPCKCVGVGVCGGG